MRDAQAVELASRDARIAELERRLARLEECAEPRTGRRSALKLASAAALGFAGVTALTSHGTTVAEAALVNPASPIFSLPATTVSSNGTTNSITNQYASLAIGIWHSAATGAGAGLTIGCETQMADGQWYPLQLVAQINSTSVLPFGQLLALKSSAVFLGNAVRVTWTIDPPGTGATFTFSLSVMGR
jgi:hypothetical protein